MEMIRSYFPISKKVVFLMVILFLILCIPINGIRAFADKFDTLQNRLEWYKSKHPIPYYWTDYKGECNEVVGYLGYLTWTAGEGGQIYGCEPGQTCNIRGTIGETTDKTINFPDEIVSDPPDDYVFSVFGFLRCTEPVLLIEPDKESMVVNEMISIKVYLKCGADVCPGQPVILKVVSGPGELELPELSPDDINMLRDKGYFFQGDIIITKTTELLGDKAEAMLYATDVGTIEIKATYESCQGIITETAIVHVGQKEAKFSGTIFFNRNLEWDKEQPDATISKRWKGNLEESATLQVTLKYTNTYQGRDYYKIEDASGTYHYSYDSKEEYRGQESGGKYTITHSAHDSGSLERSHIYCLLLHDPEKKKYTFYFSFSSPKKDGTETWDFGTDVITNTMSWGIDVGEHEYEENTDGRTFTGSWEIPGKNIKGESTEVLGTYAFVGLTGAHASWTFVKP
jgi:hypothetical protein